MRRVTLKMNETCHLGVASSPVVSLCECSEIKRLMRRQRSAVGVILVPDLRLISTRVGRSRGDPAICYNMLRGSAWDLPTTRPKPERGGALPSDITPSSDHNRASAITEYVSMCYTYGVSISIAGCSPLVF